MPKFHIDGRALSDAEIEKLRMILIDAGCHPSDIDVVRAVTKPNAEGEGEVFVCLISPAFLSDPELESTLLQAINGGRRIIGVWPPGSTKQATPPAIFKYCYSVVPWDKDRLREVLPEDDVICFQTPDGDELEMPEPERRLCP